MDQTIVRSEKYENGKTIIEEGTWAFSAYIIKSGKVKLWKVVNGKQVQFGTLNEGEIFGDMAFLGGSKRTASATAEGPVEVGVIYQDMFMDALHNLPEDLRHKAQLLVSDLSGLTDIYARLTSALQDAKEIKARMEDFKSLEKQFEKAPEYLRAVLVALIRRLHGAIEGCAKLAAEIDSGNKSVDSLAAPPRLAAVGH
ncbi:MAG: cyclic nucleotide-binding domain-containing protein [Nitrospirota bacterium]